MCFPLSMANSMILEKCLNFNNVNGFNLVINNSINEEEEDEEESVFKVILTLIIIVLIIGGGIVFYYNYHVSIVHLCIYISSFINMDMKYLLFLNGFLKGYFLEIRQIGILLTSWIICLIQRKQHLYLRIFLNDAKIFL